MIKDPSVLEAFVSTFAILVSSLLFKLHYSYPYWQWITGSAGVQKCSQFCTRSIYAPAWLIKSCFKKETIFLISKKCIETVNPGCSLVWHKTPIFFVLNAVQNHDPK